MSDCPREWPIENPEWPEDEGKLHQCALRARHHGAHRCYCGEIIYGDDDLPGQPD